MVTSKSKRSKDSMARSNASRKDRYANDPDYRAKAKARAAANRKKNLETNPEYRAKENARLVEYKKKKRADADYRAKENAASSKRNNEKYANDPEFRAKVNSRNLEAHKKRLETEPEYRAKRNARAADIHKKRYDADPEYRAAISEKTLRYMKTEKGRAAVARAGHKRRNAEANAVNDLTAEQWEFAKSIQFNRCRHCGKEFTKNNPATKDHIKASKKGGGLTLENVQALCHSCNSRKKDKDESELKYLKIKLW